MAIHVLDTFTGSDATALNSHAPDTDVPGGGWSNTRIAAAGTAGGGTIQGNQLQLANNNGGHVIYTGHTNGIVKVDWTPLGTASRFSLVFRHIAEGKMWIFNCRQPNGDYSVEEWTGLDSLTTHIGPVAFTFNTSTTYEIKVVISGHKMYFYIDDVLKEMWEDDAYLGAAHYGIVRNTADNSQRFDNFQVSDFGAGGLLNPRGFGLGLI